MKRVPTGVWLAPSKSMQEPAGFVGPPGVRKKLSATGWGPLGVTGTGWLKRRMGKSQTQTDRYMSWQTQQSGLEGRVTWWEPRMPRNLLSESGWVSHSQLFLLRGKKAHDNPIIWTPWALLLDLQGRQAFKHFLLPSFPCPKAKVSLPWYWYLGPKNWKRKKHQWMDRLSPVVPLSLQLIVRLFGSGSGWMCHTWWPFLAERLHVRLWQ